MTADAWNLLAEHSRTLVHQASLLMSALTHPVLGNDDAAAPVAARTAIAVQSLSLSLAAAPELAAHLRTVQRFDGALAAWLRSVGDSSPLERRYQTALLQQAAQVLISCLHIETLAASECARVGASPLDALTRSNHSLS